jgi:hypothetical protein
MKYVFSDISSFDLGYFASDIHGDDIRGYSLSWVRKF